MLKIKILAGSDGRLKYFSQKRNSFSSQEKLLNIVCNHCGGFPSSENLPPVLQLERSSDRFPKTSDLLPDHLSCREPRFYMQVLAPPILHKLLVQILRLLKHRVIRQGESDLAGKAVGGQSFD